LRTTTSSTMFAMFLSSLLRCFRLQAGLKSAHCLFPYVLEVGAQTGDALGAQPVYASCANFVVCHQTGFLQNPEVLRDGWAAHRQVSGQLMHCHRSLAESLKDGHAGAVAQGVQSGF